MKKEIAFFRDKRASSVDAFINTLRALGMSDDEIIAELRAYKQRRDDARKAVAESDQPVATEVQP